jgi:hypothetical protein
MTSATQGFVFQKRSSNWVPSSRVQIKREYTLEFGCELSKFVILSSFNNYKHCFIILVYFFVV